MRAARARRQVPVRRLGNDRHMKAAVLGNAECGYAGVTNQEGRKVARAANPRRAVAGATSIPFGAHRRAVR